jgi:hypothetical protein
VSASDIRAIRSPRALNNAYKKMKISAFDVAAAPQVTPFLDRIGGISTAIEILAACPAQEARTFMGEYRRPDLSDEQRRLLPFEAYCVSCGVCPSRMLELVVGGMAKQHVLEGAVIAALAHPTIMRVNAHQATFPEGVEDRMAHLKMVGAMPLPKSSQTVVNVNASATAQAAAKSEAALPAPEDTIRKMVEARQRAALPSQQPQLPPATSQTVEQAFMPRAAREPQTVDAEYEEAEE